jgi:hypothetical protein
MGKMRPTRYHDHLIPLRHDCQCASTGTVQYLQFCALFSPDEDDCAAKVLLVPLLGHEPSQALRRTEALCSCVLVLL